VVAVSSPEQVQGGKADARSDVFALGALSYELLTGRKPFDAETMHAVLFKVMQEEPPPARELLPELPAVVVQVVEKALAKDPAERFPDAGRMLAAVRKARQAVASGRGDRLLSELRPAGAARRDSRSQRAGTESSASGSQSRSSQSGVSPGRNMLPWAVAGVAVIGLLAVGFFVTRGGLGSAPTGRAAEAEAVQDLASAVVETQVELARRKLEAGDFSDAVERARGALKLDPQNADAQDILGRAQAVVERVEAAAEAARTAAAAGEAGPRADALWALMELDPSHAVVAEMAPGIGETFRPRAAEARRLMAEARGAAEASGAGRLPEFAGGTRLGQEGERAFRDGDYGTAARRFLEARDRFNRALSR
jgi:serine/threonine-protein kinase